MDRRGEQDERGQGQRTGQVATDSSGRHRDEAWEDDVRMKPIGREGGWTLDSGDDDEELLDVT